MYQFLINIVYYYLLVNITYFLTSFILFLVDYGQFFLNNKIQQKSKDWDKLMRIYKKVLSVVLINSLILTIPAIILLVIFENMLNIEFTFLKMIIDLVIGFFLLEIFFYFFHKILHLPQFYKKYHKKHHEIITPVGLSAIYTTTVDFYFGNLLPLYLPLIILSAHPITIKIWMIITTINTVMFAHSGFKYFADFHDYHHEKFNKNYGVNLFMDRLLGTYYI